MKLEQLTAIELGELVNKKVISPTEVLRYFADRIEKRNPSINAFVYTMITSATNKAMALENAIMKGYLSDHYMPLAGVPVGLKDFLPEKEGWEASHGGVKSLITVDSHDGVVYSALKKLGCIAIGKTNAPSFGFRGTTDNKMYGPTSTPYNVEYNSGGSSGGSAAAVADGLVPLASAGDAGGSTRIPAAWCGVFGFKASAGLIPSVCRPDAWTATHPYCCPGVEARSVLDSALVFDAMNTYDPRDPLSVPIKQNVFSYLKDTSKNRKYKILVTYNFDLFPNPESEIGSAMYNIAKELSLIGHKVDISATTNFKFHYSSKEIEEAWLLGISIDDAKTKYVKKAVEEHPEDMPEQFLYWHEKAKKITIEDYDRFHKIRTDILDAHLRVFEDYDIILAPVTGCSPVKNTADHDTKGPTSISGVEIDPLIGFGYTYLENMIGTPAASIPVGLDSNGLPIGLQVISRRYDDEKVFQLCKDIEEIVEWDYTRPYDRM